MTKKDFIELTDYHYYRGRSKKESIVALFFDWKVCDEGTGFKYCVFACATNSNKKELINSLYNVVVNDEDTDWWIHCIVAPEDRYRFKVPISGSGLRSLIKYERVVDDEC